MALAEIVARKRLDVGERKQADPLEGWRDGLTRSDRPFRIEGQTGYILECKRASPSEGVLRSHLDVQELACAYAPFATAISVLTDTPYFNGSFDDLARVRQSVTQPVLCKDFIVDPYQVYEARRHGADIILLMLSVLDDPTYRICSGLASELGLDVLTEVHDEAELQRAIDLGAVNLGINNRNLKTLDIDLNVSVRLIGRTPPQRTRISESGLRTHADIRKLRDLGFAGFLVGSSLMKAPRLDVAVRELIFGRVKVCGLTEAEAARAAWDAGATWGGLIFHPASPRGVTLDRAVAIRAGAPLHWVGVFVNRPMDDVVAAAGALNLSAVQLHGDESDEYVTALRTRIDAEIWKVYRVQDSLPGAMPPGVDRVLFDTWKATARGGTGQAWDWTLLDQCPYRSSVVLSGGLAPHNAVRADGCAVWALDVNSGVESSPGHKDPGLLRDFFAALRNGFRDQG